MGYISSLARTGDSVPHRRSGKDSRATWREIFGSTDKERDVYRPRQPGGYGRSVSSTDAAYMRLLQAMRSMAPGGWSDNRWEQTKHFVGPVYVAIDRKCRQLSQSEFQVFQRDPSHPEGKRPVTENDPPQGGRDCKPYDLVTLLEKPNNQDSWGKLMWRWGQQLNLTGMALTWMVPNAYSVPVEIYPVPTAIAIPQPTVNPDFPDGYYRIQPVYPYGPFSSYPTPASAVGAAVPAQWMLRFLWPHPLLRYEGYSPQTGGNLHIDGIEMIDRSRHYKMRRGSNPDAVLNAAEGESAAPLDPTEIDRIHFEWENEQSGPENHGKLIVGTPGYNLETWGGPSPREMDYGQSWEQLLSFIMGGVFGITKPAAGMIEDANYSTLFATIKQLHLLTLQPDCDDIASELTRHLAPFFGDNLIVEIRTKRIDDHEIKEKWLRLLMEGKAITKNEMRKETEFPLTDDKWGADIAGDPSPIEQEQEEQESEAQMMRGASEARERELGLGEEITQDNRQEPEEVTASRPKTGSLGQGSLGPRKSLNSKVKSFYDVVRGSLNGNGRK